MKILSIAVCVGHIGFHGPRVKKRQFARLCNACLASTVERLLLLPSFTSFTILSAVMVLLCLCDLLLTLCEQVKLYRFKLISLKLYEEEGFLHSKP